MPTEQLWKRIAGDRRRLIGQLVRYGVVGLGVTLAQAAVYWTLASHTHLHVQLANFAGYIVAVILGYYFHGRYTFAEPSRKSGVGGHAARGSRFVAASLISYGLNALWVWLFVTAAGWQEWTPVPAMLFVTPTLVFVLNKKWVFR